MDRVKSTAKARAVDWADGGVKKNLMGVGRKASILAFVRAGGVDSVAVAGRNPTLVAMCRDGSLPVSGYTEAVHAYERSVGFSETCNR